MIHDVKDVTALLDRRFGGAGAGPLSLLRIAAWTVLGLLLLGAAFHAAPVRLNASPYNRKIASPLVRDVTLDKNDPRGFQTRKDKSAFTIAWVGPSTLQSIGKRYSFIPADVRDRIPEVNGKRVKIDMYFMSGARVYDIYAATLAALASKPDMIIVDLNPIWIFNEVAVQAWDNLDGRVFPYAVQDAGAWPLIAAFDSPEDVALGLASHKLSALHDRWSYAQTLREKIDSWNPLTIPTVTPRPGTAPSPLSKLQGVAQKGAPLFFWQAYRPAPGPRGSRAQGQLTLLRQSDVDGGTVNDLVVNRLFAAMSAAKIPAFAYVPPVNPEFLAEPGADETLGGIERRIREIAAEHRSPTLYVQNESAVRFLPPMKFNDLAHLAEDGPFVTYLSDLICHQLVRLEVTPRCVPLPAAPSASPTPRPTP